MLLLAERQERLVNKNNNNKFSNKMKNLKNKKIFLAAIFAAVMFVFFSQTFLLGNKALADSITFTNPLSYTTVESFLDNVLSSIQKIVVVLALIFLIIGAVMYIVSTGESETVERAKKAITMAIMGVVIAIAAPSILKEIGTVIGWTDVSSSSTTSSALTLSEIAVKVLDFLLGISGVLSIIMMVIGGMMYLTSAGDEERIKKGKDIFKFSVLGIIIVLASLVIVRQIAKFFVSS